MSEIGIVILAAGPSSRLGFPKQLLEFQGEALIRRCIKGALMQSSDVVTVLGAHFKQLKSTISDLDTEVVFNLDWRKGLGSSITKGLEYIHKKNPGLEAVIFLACDQPLVDQSFLAELIRSYQLTSGSLITWSKAQLKFPVLIDRSYFKSLIKINDQAELTTINRHFSLDHFSENFKSVFDIDTEADWKTFIRHYPDLKDKSLGH